MQGGGRGRRHGRQDGNSASAQEQRPRVSEELRHGTTHCRLSCSLAFSTNNEYIARRPTWSCRRRSCRFPTRTSSLSSTCSTVRVRASSTSSNSARSTYVLSWKAIVKAHSVEPRLRLVAVQGGVDRDGRLRRQQQGVVQVVRQVVPGRQGRVAQPQHPRCGLVVASLVVFRCKSTTDGSQRRTGILVANKTDLRENNRDAISAKDAQEFADRNDLKYFECSAVSRRFPRAGC